MEAASGVKNMALAHEIAVNTDFKLESFQPPDDRYWITQFPKLNNKKQDIPVFF